MCKYTIHQPMTVEYFFSDHLGSTSLTTDSNGAKVSEMRYDAWGEVRYSWTSGQATTPSYILPNYTFTGQYSDMDDPTTMANTEGFGLMFYNARWYDPYLNHFTQADSIIPSGVQGLDHYAYANNNPIRYVDPSGHCTTDGDNWCYHDNEDSWTSTWWWNTSYGSCGLDSACNKDRETYVRAGINYHKTGAGSWNLFGRKFSNFFHRGEYDSIGPAQVSDIEMETPYGKELLYPGTNKVRKTGLGLRSDSCDSGCSMDQEDSVIASIAMRTRLTLRLNVCAEHKCTATDRFVVAVLSIDEQIAPSELAKAFNGKYNSQDPNTNVVDWEKFINTKMGPEQYALIHKIQDQVNTLLNEGYDVPSGVDWNYITGLNP